jgi:hypothetical protein
MSQLRPQYEVGIGSVDVDLRSLDLPAGRTDLAIDVGLGQALIYVPENVCVTSDVQIGAGLADVLDRDNDGIDVSFVERADPAGSRPVLHIDADVGAGVFEVVRDGFTPNSVDHNWEWDGPRGGRGLIEGASNCA